MSRAVNLKWANRILRSKNFVVLTDKESVIYLDGIDPDSMSDLITLTAQASSLQVFTDRLQQLQKRHEKKIIELSGSVEVTKGGSIEKTAIKTRKKAPKSPRS